MPLPQRLRSLFREATLRPVEEHPEKFRVSKPLFFRSVYTANVTENERRSFQPIVAVEGTRVQHVRCTCSEDLRPGDLCRHLAALMVHATDGTGELSGDRFETSLWKAIGHSLHLEGAEPPAFDEADPREQRLRKLALTPQEQELAKRGAMSGRLVWESSPWYRWSRDEFVGATDVGSLRIEYDGAKFVLQSRDLRIPLPASAVEHVVLADGGAIAKASGFEVRHESLTPTFRIEVTESRGLRFRPALIDWKGSVHDRLLAPKFGRCFLIANVFATVKNVAPMFAEKAKARQHSLFETRPAAGLPFDRETVIEEEAVLKFIESHAETLAAMPDELVPESVRNARPLRLDDEVLFDFATGAGGFLDIGISFRVGDETISIAEIAAARKAGIRALNRGNLWIDVADSQFSWADGMRITRSGRAGMTKLEYLRVRGSLRGRAVFSGDPQLEEVFHLFDHVDGVSDAPPVADLGMDLYGYQQTGYRWLWQLQSNDFGALLCDDMGLGKTHQAMALIRALTVRGKSGHLPYLVVCPTSLLEHWRDKLALYAPTLKVDVHRGGGREPKRDADVIVTSYGVIRNDVDRFRSINFDVVVADEIQAIKNRDTATHQALAAIHRRVSVGLTGTPVENHTGELKSLVDFIVPGYLPPGAAHDDSLLRRLVSPFVLRRTKSQVLTELPPKIVDRRWCDMTPEQMWLYKQVVNSRGRALRAQIRAGARIPYLHVFAALNYLKQICNHPQSVTGGLATDAPSGKWNLFLELLEESLSSGLKVVVFSQYLGMLRMIEKHLAAEGVGYSSIKGETKDRGGAIRRFHEDPDCRVFTASLKAGGLGIDLTPASVVIHYDRWWNQAREDQATDRVHRLGQNRGVQVIKLITRGTLEEKIDALIERKAALASEMISEDDPTLVKQFTPQELEELLDFAD